MFCWVPSNTPMPILSGKMEHRVKYWPKDQQRAGCNEGGLSKHTLLFMKPHIDHFPLATRSAPIMWCYKCCHNNTVHLWSGCLWGAQTFLQTWSHSCCLRSYIQLQNGSLFQTMQTISFRGTQNYPLSCYRFRDLQITTKWLQNCYSRKGGARKWKFSDFIIYEVFKY